MIVAVCNAKGGSGKTTLTVLLATALVEAGHPVAVLDTDPQKTATRWIEDTGNRVTIAHNGKRYGGTLFIDTPPQLASAAVVDAVHKANLILVVSSPSPADLYTTRETVELLEAEQVKQKARLFFNQVLGRTVLARELDDMADRIGLPALKSRLNRRQAYQHAVVLGWKALSADAREEVLRAALEVISLGL